jgi:NAD(P)-dependent dehydrogenase (short-subunit alcohol dehydrogenase family)
VKRTFDDLTRQTRIHILVNNAGISHIGTVETTTPEDFDRIVHVNIKGFYNCMHAMVGHMKDSGGGVILNMASIAGSAGLPDRFAYSMSKGAVIAMTYSVARDYLSSPCSHSIRRQISGEQLSRQGERDVRKAGALAADRKNGGSRGGSFACLVSMLG